MVVKHAMAIKPTYPLLFDLYISLMELYLQTEVLTDADLSSTSFLHIDGRVWQRIGPLSPDEPSTRPEFACISYVWGPTCPGSSNQRVAYFNFLDRCILYTGD